MAQYVFREVRSPPNWCDTTPPTYLVSGRRNRAIHRFARYRTMSVRHPPMKTNTKELCHTIATSIARYEEHWSRHCLTMCFLAVSSRPCLETNPHDTIHWTLFRCSLRGKPCPAGLSEGVNRVFRTLSGDTPLPIPQAPSAEHCLDTHSLRLQNAIEKAFLKPQNWSRQKP